MEYNISDVGKRVKKRRKELGLTQKTFIDLLREKGIKIGRNTLSAFENGGQIDLDIYRLKAMSEILSCDIGFLIGEYDECKTKDAQGVRAYTGLSASSIELLSKLSEDPEGAEIIQEIDRLILDRRVIRRLHTVSVVSAGIIHSDINADNISPLRGMLEVALLDLNTQVQQYAHDTLNAEKALNMLSNAEMPKRIDSLY